MTNVAHFPLLSLILFLPLAGAALLLFVPKENGNAIRWIANLFAFGGFLVSLPLWFWYNSQDAQFQFVERIPGFRRSAPSISSASTASAR